MFFILINFSVGILFKLYLEKRFCLIKNPINDNITEKKSLFSHIELYVKKIRGFFPEKNNKNPQHIHITPIHWQDSGYHLPFHIYHVKNKMIEEGFTYANFTVKEKMYFLFLRKKIKL